MQVEQELRGWAFRLGQGQHKISCPSCSHSRKKKNEKTLSFKIESEEAVYNCWHCGMNGLVSINDTFPTIKVQRKVEVVSVAKKIETSPLGENAISFLRQRGISEETARKANLTFGRNYIHSAQAEVGCIFFLTQTRVSNTLRRLDQSRARALLVTVRLKLFSTSRMLQKMIV